MNIYTCNFKESYLIYLQISCRESADTDNAHRSNK